MSRKLYALVTVQRTPATTEPAAASQPATKFNYSPGMHVLKTDGSSASIDEAVQKGWLTVEVEVEGNSKVAHVTNRTGQKVTVGPIYIQPGESKTLKVSPSGNAIMLPTDNSDVVKLLMPIVISIVLLLGGLFVILAKRYAASDRHWAYATVGTIVGYWLKG